MHEHLVVYSLVNQTTFDKHEHHPEESGLIHKTIHLRLLPFLFVFVRFMTIPLSSKRVGDWHVMIVTVSVCACLIHEPQNPLSTHNREQHVRQLFPFLLMLVSCMDHL